MVTRKNRHLDARHLPIALISLIILASSSISNATSLSLSDSGSSSITRLLSWSSVSTSRKLDEQQQDGANGQQGAGGDDTNDDANANEDFQYDLSQYSLKYEKCQYVKMYDDEVAQDQDSTSPLALKHFVLYRLCPSDSCEQSSCDKDGVAYGKYTVPVEDYLQYVVENRKRTLENLCKQCEQGCTDDGYTCDDGEDCSNSLSCSTCQTGCYQYQNLEDNGYVDASDYIECQKLDAQEQQQDDKTVDDGAEGDQEQQQQAQDDQQQQQGENQAEGEDGGRRTKRRAEENNDDGQQQLYIGPSCNKYGKIVIGLFSDEKCWEPVYDQDVESLLGYKLSYHLLNESYVQNSGCLSCKEDKNNEDERDAEDADDVNEMCEEIYDAAAKCESETGLDVGFVQMNREDKNYENQLENEFLACTFIDSLIWNSYTETGEINIAATQDVIVRMVTQKQTIALSLLGFVILATLGVMYYLDRRIKQVVQNQPLVAKGDSTLI